MYIKDGFVYGMQSVSSIKVTDIKVLPDMMMLLTFNNNECRLFDGTSLTGVAFDPLKDEANFRRAELDHGVVTWLDGSIDCAPEYMYEHSFAYETLAV